MKRRAFLNSCTATAAGWAVATIKPAMASEHAFGANERTRTAIESVHGFNYQPSYAYNGADIWRRFDAAAFDCELDWGKKHFPKMNGVRLWLAWEVFAGESPA